MVILCTVWKYNYTKDQLEYECLLQVLDCMFCLTICLPLCLSACLSVCLSVSLGIMSTVPAGYGGAMITEQLRGHRNNNDDGDLSSEKVHRDSLLSGVSDKLKRRMRNTKDAAEVSYP